MAILHWFSTGTQLEFFLLELYIEKWAATPNSLGIAKRPYTRTDRQPTLYELSPYLVYN